MVVWYLWDEDYVDSLKETIFFLGYNKFIYCTSNQHNEGRNQQYKTYFRI